MNVDDFIDEYDDNMSNFIIFNANNDEFLRLSKPLDTLSLYADLIVWLVVSNAIVIITLVVALTLKTREFEIGVLLSLGSSKLKIVAQFFTELALVAIIGFSLAYVSCSLVSKRLGDAVLNYQIQQDDTIDSSNEYYNSIWDDNYQTHITLDDLVGEYDSSISIIIVLEIYLIGLGIVFISTVIPALMIMRYNPKQILMNQN